MFIVRIPTVTDSIPGLELRNSPHGEMSMKKRYFLKSTLVAGLAAATLSTSALAANAVLKIGFVGVTSGPAAAWGISNQRSMETRAAWINETGGVKIGGTTYNIEIVAFDDQKDPKRAIAGMEKMAQEASTTLSVLTLTTAQQRFVPWQSKKASCTSLMLSLRSFTPSPPRTLSWAWSPTTNPALRSTST